MKNIIAALRISVVASLLLTLVVSFLYPMVVWGFAQALFSDKAKGSLIEKDGKIIGSSLIGQTFTSPQYFHSRPSAAGKGYDAASSGGSNLGPLSDKLLNGIADNPETSDVDESFAGLKQRVENYRQANQLAPDVKVPGDAVTGSASGLDPHISPRNAELQVARVARARGLSEDLVRKLLDEATEQPEFFILGEARVNVVMLNLALDKNTP